MACGTPGRSHLSSLPSGLAFPSDSSEFSLQSIQGRIPGTLPLLKGCIWHRWLPSPQPETHTCQEHPTYPSCDIFVSPIIFLPPNSPLQRWKCWIHSQFLLQNLEVWSRVACWAVAGLLYLAVALVRWGAHIVTNLISSPPPGSSAAAAEPAQLTESTEAVALSLPLTSPDHLALGGVKC